MVSVLFIIQWRIQHRAYPAYAPPPPPVIGENIELSCIFLNSEANSEANTPFFSQNVAYAPSSCMLHSVQISCLYSTRWFLQLLHYVLCWFLTSCCILSRVPSGRYWLGLNRDEASDADGGWSWVDGSPYSWTNWVPKNPKIDTRCAVMTRVNGVWLSVDCDEKTFKFICKKVCLFNYDL